MPEFVIVEAACVLVLFQELSTAAEVEHDNTFIHCVLQAPCVWKEIIGDGLNVEEVVTLQGQRCPVPQSLTSCAE